MIGNQKNMINKISLKKKKINEDHGDFYNIQVYIMRLFSEIFLKK